MTRASILKFAGGLAALSVAVLSVTPASAVPAFAQQTGQPCQACHVGAFGPQLTAFGRRFKLNGYTLRARAEFTPPVSAMLVASYVDTAKDQPSPPAPHYGTNNNATIDEASLFLAGGIGQHFGGFAQFTYDGVGRAFSWDNLDLRAVDTATLEGHDVLFGVSLNNNPTIQDVWATTPGWGFPYTGSDLAPGPDAASLISDALAQNVIGASAYAWLDDSLYAEAGAYTSPDAGFLKTVGVDPGDTSEIDGAAPYFRVAYEKGYGNQNFEVGAFGLFADLYPGRDRSAGTTDGYGDLGLDASYQYLSDANTYTLNARYISETRDLRATKILGGTAGVHSHLDEFNANAAYYWNNTIGGTVQYFDTWGSGDALLYGGNRTFKPDSSGFTFQVDGTPFGHDMSAPLGGRFNMRLGLQYTVYTKFNGAGNNYDGTGRNAADNNTVRLFAWFAL